MNIQSEKPHPPVEEDYETIKKKICSLLKEVAEKRVDYEFTDRETFILFVARFFGENGRSLMHDCIRHSEHYNKNVFDLKFTDYLLNKEGKLKIFPHFNIVCKVAQHVCKPYLQRLFSLRFSTLSCLHVCNPLYMPLQIANIIQQ